MDIRIPQNNYIFDLISFSRIHLGTIEFPQLQDEITIAIGRFAGFYQQHSRGIAIGDYAACTNQAEFAIALGTEAGTINQFENSVAIGKSAGYSSQKTNAIAIGSLSGSMSQMDGSVAIGKCAGILQGTHAIAIGIWAGCISDEQGMYSIALGAGASGAKGNNSVIAGFEIDCEDGVGQNNIAIGYNINLSTAANSIAINASNDSSLDLLGCSGGFFVKPVAYDSTPRKVLLYHSDSGQIFQSNNLDPTYIDTIDGVPEFFSDFMVWNGAQWSAISDTIHIGPLSAVTQQGSEAVAIGTQSALTGQNTGAVAIGTVAAFQQGRYAIAMGCNSGQEIQGEYAIAIGPDSGKYVQGVCSISVGNTAGLSHQGSSAIAMGYEAGNNSQHNLAIALGYRSGYNSQGTSAIAIGYCCGFVSQGVEAIAIGNCTGYIGQSTGCIAVGEFSGNSNQSENAIAIGQNAGFLNQSTAAIAIGRNAGNSGQSSSAIALGVSTGVVGQQQFSIAIGEQAGNLEQAQNCIALGSQSGAQNQKAYSIAIGAKAGYLDQDQHVISIGANAQSTFSNSIVISSRSSNYFSNGSLRFLVNPQNIRSQPNSYYTLQWDSTSGEISVSDQVTSNIGTNITQIIPTPHVFSNYFYWSTITSKWEIGTTKVAIGSNAGSNEQGTDAIAIGYDSGKTQSSYSISIGCDTLYNTTIPNQTIGQNTIVMGYRTSCTFANSIVFNTSDTLPCQGSTSVAFFVRSIPQYTDRSLQLLQYSPITGEVSVTDISSLSMFNTIPSALDFSSYVFLDPDENPTTVIGSSIIHLGNNAGRNGLGTEAIAIGSAADVVGNYSVVIGANSTSNGVNLMNILGNNIVPSTVNNWALFQFNLDTSSLPISQYSLNRLSDPVQDAYTFASTRNWRSIAAINSQYSYAVTGDKYIFSTRDWNGNVYGWWNQILLQGNSWINYTTFMFCVTCNSSGDRPIVKTKWEFNNGTTELRYHTPYDINSTFDLQNSWGVIESYTITGSQLNISAHHPLSLKLTPDGSRLYYIFSDDSIRFKFYSTNSSGTRYLLNGTTGYGWSFLTSNTSGTILYAATTTSRLYKITVGSQASASVYNCTLAQLNSAGIRLWSSIACSLDGSIIVACVTSGHVYVSTNSGTNWTENILNGGSQPWTSVCCSTDGVYLYVVSSDGKFFASQNSGSSWTKRDTLYPYTTCWSQVACYNDGKSAILGTYQNLSYNNTTVLNTMGGNDFISEQSLYIKPIRQSFTSSTNYLLQYLSSSAEVSMSSVVSYNVLKNALNYSDFWIWGDASYTGETDQWRITRRVRLGSNSGYSTDDGQVPYAIAIGNAAAQTNQQAQSIAIGSTAASLGTNAIVIGISAISTYANSICMNASSTSLASMTTNTCTIKPIRQIANQGAGSGVVTINSQTSEVIVLTDILPSSIPSFESIKAYVVFGVQIIANSAILDIKTALNVSSVTQVTRVSGINEIKIGYQINFVPGTFTDGNYVVLSACHRSVEIETQTGWIPGEENIVLNTGIFHDYYDYSQDPNGTLTWDIRLPTANYCPFVFYRTPFESYPYTWTSNYMIPIYVSMGFY